MGVPDSGRIFPARQAQVHNEPMNGGHRAGHIDRFTGVYEEIILDTNMKSRVLVRGKCVVPTKPRKF